MKALKLITTVLITLSILLTGFVAFQFTTSGQGVIGTGITLVLLFFFVVLLFSYRLALSVGHKNITTPTILTVALIAFLLIIYFNRPWINTIWNYGLACFIILQGTTLLKTINSESQLGRILKILTAGTVSLLAILVLIKAGNTILYTASAIALTLASLGILISLFLKKKNQSA